MIYCALYTSERMNPIVSVADLPLKLFKEIDVSVPTPTVYDGFFYSKSDDGRLACYDEKTGRVVWISQTEKVLTTSPLKFKNKLYVIDYDNENTIAIDAHTGQFLESFGEADSSGWVLKGSNIYGKDFCRDDDFPCQLVCQSIDSHECLWKYKGLQFDHYAASDDYILLKDKKGSLACLNPAGQEIWYLSPIDTELFSSQSEIDNIPERTPEFVHLNQTLGYPMIYQNRIGVVPMLDHHLMGIDLATGKVLWTRRVENTISSLRQGYCDEVYCLGNSFIEAFSMETGEQTKKVAIDGSYIQESLGLETVSFTQFAVSGTHIFTASHNMHYLTAIEIKTGKVVWTFQPEVAVTASDQPYVANGRVYFPCLCKMYIFEGKDGYALAE